MINKNCGAKIPFLFEIRNYSGGYLFRKSDFSFQKVFVLQKIVVACWKQDGMEERRPCGAVEVCLKRKVENRQAWMGCIAVAFGVVYCRNVLKMCIVVFGC